MSNDFRITWVRGDPHIGFDDLPELIFKIACQACIAVPSVGFKDSQGIEYRCRRFDKLRHSQSDNADFVIYKLAASNKMCAVENMYLVVHGKGDQYDSHTSV